MSLHSTLSTGSVPTVRVTQAALSLMQQLIRLASVNDGTPESGHEIEAALLLQRFFEESSAPIDIQVLESMPGRASIVARVHGTNPDAPVLGLLGHLDVVPVDEDRWQRNPFGGDLIDGEVWGRGAVDMLYLTASFAVVVREIAEAAQAGYPLEGDLVFIGVADEEGGSRRGMQWLASEHAHLVAVDEVLTEAGGMRIGERIAVSVAEKGSAARRLHVEGRSGHASAPFGSDNAIEALGEVVRRLSVTHEDRPVLHPLWHQFVSARVADTKLATALTDSAQVDAHLGELDALAGYAHAVTRTTVTPTVVRAGQAHNVIPAIATVDLDIRPLPGVSDDDVDAMLVSRLGDLAGRVRIERLYGWNSSESSTDSQLFDTVQTVLGEQLGREVVPIMAAGGSDARFFRYQGIPAYGFGVLSESWTYEKYRSRIHGHDERIDVDSVQLTVTALLEIVQRRVAFNRNT